MAPAATPLPPRDELLQRLHLKTVIKEHHAQPVRALCFNQLDAHKGNLFATVGGSQATIYNNEHFGSFISSVAQFVNSRTEHTAGGELVACCWLPDGSGGADDEPLGDTLLAVAGGTDHCVSVLSITCSAAVALLKGHTKDVIDLAACAARPGLLLSLSKDGTVRLWDVRAAECIAVVSGLQHPSAVCFKAGGDGFFVAHSGGQLSACALPAVAVTGKRKRGDATVQVDAAAAATPLAAHGSAVDCLRVLAGGRLVSKGANGSMVAWEAATGKQLASWKVPGCNGDRGRSAFGATADGEVVVVGNASGDVYAYAVATGKKITQLKPGKVRAPVLAAACTDDCRNVLAVFGGGFVWRWELITAGAAAAAAGLGAAPQSAAAADDDDDE